MPITGIDAATGEYVAVHFDQGITAVEHLIGMQPEPGVYVAPGFVDLQVNGFAGVDYNSPETSHEEIARSLDEQFKTGVTRVLPTVVTGAQERLEGSLRNLVQARAQLEHGHAMEGFHVEGPHISAEDGPRGAHPVQHVRPPNLDEFQRLQEAADGYIRLVTLSPEYGDQSVEFIRSVTRQGVVISIGHTKATADQIRACVDAGATLSTHLGNGAHAVLPRHPNYIWEQLAEDRLTACFIVDNIHLGDAFLKSCLRAKGIEKSVLVTDAVAPAGCPPGDYNLGGIEVTLHPDDSVRLRGGARLAGSSLKMHKAVGNVMRTAGVSIRDAVTMAGRNPARVARMVSRQRGLQPGERADLVRFRLNEVTRDITVLETYLGGKLVYDAAA